MKVINILAISICILFYATVIPYHTKVTASYGQVLFSDNFSDGNDIGWQKQHVSGATNTIPLWQVLNGRYGMNLLAYGTVGNSFNGNETWTDYKYEFDMYPELGVNRNFLFRVNETSPGSNSYLYYELHVSGNNINLHKIANSDPNLPIIFPVTTTFNIENNHIYNWKTELIGNNIKVYVKENTQSEYTKIIDVYDNNSPVLTGRIGLRIGTGLDYTRIYFDNIVVTDLTPDPTPTPIPTPTLTLTPTLTPTPLPTPTPTPPGFEVPYYSQRDYHSIYDSTKKKISDLGCALTSAAMVLRYHQIFLLPDLYLLNPNTLNTYLINNHGYGLGGGIIFDEISRITYLMSTQSGMFNFKALDYHKLKPPDYANLDATLSAALNPVILEITEPTSPSGVHFVVARGVVNSGREYVINDPFDQDVTRLLIPPKNIVSTRFFEPTNTNLSSILIQTNEPVVLTITDPHGNITNPTANSIPQSSLTLDLPILDDGDHTATAGPSIWEFYAEDPKPGKYTVKAAVNGPAGLYELWLQTYNYDGSHNVFRRQVFIGPLSPYQLNLHYDPRPEIGSTFKHPVTFSSLRSLIKTTYQEGWLKSLKTRDFLLAHVTLAEVVYQKRPQAGKILLATIYLHLNHAQRQGILIEPGLSWLKEEVGLLLAQL